MKWIYANICKWVVSFTSSAFPVCVHQTKRFSLRKEMVAWVVPFICSNSWITEEFVCVITFSLLTVSHPKSHPISTPKKLGVSDLLRSLCANDTMNLGRFKTILWNSKWLFAFVKVNPECRSFFPWISFSFLCFGSFGFCFWSTSGAVTQDRR